MDPQVIRDPVFQTLLQKHELAGRKLRDAVVALRSFHLTTTKAPEDYDTGDIWRAANLQETAVQRLEEVRSCADDLLRYGFEIVPHSSCPQHLSIIDDLKAAHTSRTGGNSWGEASESVRGIEEQVQVDGGPPITIVIQPKHYEFTQKAKRTQDRKKPE